MTSNEALYPFDTFKTQALFDPQVDYIYINKLTFDNFLQPVLKTIYMDDIVCSDTECHFETSCDRVQKKGVELMFQLTGA
jgi:hypothetical protein